MCKHTSNSIIERLLGQVARLVGRVHDFVVEHREVKGKTQADGVSGGKVCLGDLSGILVSLERLVGRFLAAITESELGKVTVVVTLPVRPLDINSQKDHRDTDILW